MEKTESCGFSNDGILPLPGPENRQQGDGYIVPPQGTVHVNVALELCSVAVLRKRDSLSDGGACVFSPHELPGG